MTELVVAFQNFANFPKMAVISTGFKTLNKVKLLDS